MADKKLLATLTKEEAEKFLEIKNTQRSIKEMQSYLLEEMTDCLNAETEIWNEIKIKYGVDVSARFVYETREVRAI